MFFTKKQNFDVMDLIPGNLRSGLAIDDNKLCISEAIKYEPVVQEIYNAFLIQKIISGFEFYKPTEFSEKFSHNTLSLAEISNDIQNFAKSVWNDAYHQEASDIHIKDMGLYGLIRFRIDGMLRDYKLIEANRCREVIRTIYSTMCGNGDTSFSYRIRQDARIISDDYLPKGMHSSRVHIEPTEKKDSPEGIGSCLYARLLYDIIKATGSLENRLAKLGFLDCQIETVRYLTTRTGLNIISGPTGHGKSTALPMSFGFGPFPASSTSSSRRISVSSALLACSVPIPPGCPVFHAFKSSSAALSRTSPTNIRFGAYRIQTFVRLCMVIFAKSLVLKKTVFSELD